MKKGSEIVTLRANNDKSEVTSQEKKAVRKILLSTRKSITIIAPIN